MAEIKTEVVEVTPVVVIRKFFEKDRVVTTAELKALTKKERWDIATLIVATGVMGDVTLVEAKR